MDQAGSNDEKNLGSIISLDCPFNIVVKFLGDGGEGDNLLLLKAIYTREGGSKKLHGSKKHD